MVMNKKGNWFWKGLFLIVFIGVWIAIAPTLGKLTGNYVTTNNATGLTAWFLANINYTIFILLILFIAGWTIMTERNTEA